MRVRLVLVFLVPLVGAFLVLGGAYAWSLARTLQQEFNVEQLGDLSYFGTSARQALRSGNTSVIQSEMDRHRELYGTNLAVVDRAGVIWVSSGFPSPVFDEATTAQLRLALSGRRGEAPQSVMPWLLHESVFVEPVFDDGDVIGAVVLKASSEQTQTEILQRWAVLAGIAILATLVGVFVVRRLANWVLLPVKRVDEAMEAVEKGHIEARIDDTTGPPELRHMILRFNRMAEEMEHVVQRQQEFALNASHELRNPLNALLVRLEFLATGLSESWHEDVEATREEGRRMTRILDTLLNLAKSGRGDSAFSLVDLSQLVQRRAEAWGDVAAERGIAFVLHADGKVLCDADATVVESVLDAVIDNAVKYSPSASDVVITTTSVHGQCEIIVRDYGPGVDEGELSRLTERFWRSPNSKEVAGSGLGLAIAADLIATIDGELHVALAEGAGLEVRMSFSKGVFA